MALSNKRYHPLLSRLHLVARLLGLVGLMVALTGLVLLQVEGTFRSPGEKERPRFSEWCEAVVDRLGEALRSGEDVTRDATLGAWLLAVGLAVGLLELLVELVVLVRLTAGRRSAVGLNAGAQVALAVVLVVGVNIFSFEYFERIDCTRVDENTGRQAFTLPEDVREQLQTLRGETTIVILQQRRKADRGEEMEDYASAAEAVTVEKLRDVADQLRNAGAERLRVVLLDARKREYRSELAQVTDNKPKLAEAIRNAPGNSIIFHSTDGKREQVQRIGFEDFLQLDQTLSREADNGRGNLVLLDKGIRPLTRRIFNLEEKRPRVGVLVVHEAFASDSQAPFWSLAGLKKSLAQQGFDVRDVILKRNLRRGGGRGPMAPPTGWQADPDVALLEETKYQRQRRLVDRLPIVIEQLKASIRQDQKKREFWEKATVAQIREQIELFGLPGTVEEVRKSQVTLWSTRIDSKQHDLDDLREELEKTKKDLAGTSEDVIEEQTQTTDLPAKLERVLADCDLLLIARPPVWPYGYEDDGSLNRLEDFQVRAIKDFMRNGKPILACISPVVQGGRLPGLPGMDAQPDNLEQLLAELDIRLGKHALVYPTQSVDTQLDPLTASEREIPVPDFRTPFRDLARPTFLKKPGKEDNPIRQSLSRTARARDRELDLRLRFPRPVYYRPDPKKPLDNPPARKTENPAFAPELLWTQATAWNTDNPENATRFEEPKPDDPLTGTIDEKRQGAFPIGVAVEAVLPQSWRTPDSKASKTRVAVIGQGQAFAELELNPAREKLLLDTCNWLLGREDLLTVESPRWEYPRLRDLEPKEKLRWLWAIRLGLPALFAFLGLVVLMVRRVR